MAKFKAQNPTHNEKRLQCECGSWNWKIQMEFYLHSPLYVCAECGETVSASSIESEIVKDHEHG